MGMDELLAANRATWSVRAALHLGAYPVEEFLVGRNTLHQIELDQMGDVAGLVIERHNS